MPKKRKDGEIIGTAYCPICEEDVSVSLIDNGFAYEYGSTSGIHCNWIFECSACGEQISAENVTETEDSRDYGDDL